MPIWGYYIAQRKRKLLLKLAAAQNIGVMAASASATASVHSSTQPTDSASPIDSSRKDRRDFESIVHLINKWREDEWRYFADIRQEQLSLLENKLKDIKERSARVDLNYSDKKRAPERSLLIKSVSAVAEKFDKEMGKNVLLLIAMCAILTVDVLIARQIFRSLGIATDETFVSLWGKKIPFDYPLVYGIFMTIVAAFALHWFWQPRGRIESVLRSSKWSIVGGVAILIFFFIIRLLTVIKPDNASRFMEVLTLACWMIGVIAVYWLNGEIIGEGSDFFKLLIAMAAPIAIVLYLVFGGLAAVKHIIEWTGKGLLKAWFELRRTRAEQQQRNIEEKYQDAKKGFYRGLSL